MTKEFKTLLYSNFMFLISKLNLKIGEFEAKAGMTPGYLSKLQKEESKSNNILDFMVNASKILGVSIDSLVSVDYSSLTNIEKYFADFIDKLIRETTEGKLCWDKELISNLNDFSYQYTHPLFEATERYSDTYEPKKFGYKSLFCVNAEIASDCYNVTLNDSTLYLMTVNISPDSFEFAQEMYFVKYYQGSEEPEVIKICQIKENSPLSKIANNLVMAAKESSNHIKIDNNARNIIDDFMNEENIKDIPF